MIKCHMDKQKGKVKVKVTGTGQDITTELMALITEVYNGIKETSPEAADIFKRCIIAGAIDPNSPVWAEK